jgi:hypothetical protein
MPQAPDTTNHYGARAGRARHFGLPLLLLLVAFAVCVAAVAASSAGAQSGRRKTAPLSPVPTPTPAPEAVGESESESRPRRQVSTQLSLVVYQLDGTFGHVDFAVQDAVMNGLMERLRRSKDLSASRADKRISRKEAQDIAKGDPASHVVLVELEDDIAVGGSRGGVGQTDTRALAIKTYVYEPVTGTLKFVDHTSQRPYRQGTSIGGIRLPLPSPRTRIERFPNELQLEQAARDAADRIMQRFNLRLPPDN